MYQQDNEQTAGETVCAQRRNNALLHETPKQTPAACSLEPCADVLTTITSLPDSDKEKKHWRRMLCMRLPSQMSVASQTQHQDQSAFFRML